jgi:DNA-binding FrmR family transcriptional regulator
VDDEYRLVTDATLAAATHALPAQPGSVGADGPDVSWSEPAPRLHAAKALLFIALRSPHSAEEVVIQVTALAADHVPAVRFLVAHHLTCLANSAAEAMWSVLEEFGINETNAAVLQTVVGQPLARLLALDADRVGRLVEKIAKRTGEEPLLERVAESCGTVIAAGHVLYEDAFCRDLVYQITANAVSSPQALGLVGLQREWLSSHLVGGSQEDLAQRVRALNLMNHVTVAACEQWRRALTTQHAPSEQADETEKSVKRLVALLRAVTSSIFFASGAFKEKEASSNGRILTIEEKAQFLKDTGHAIDLLAEAGVPGITHELIETLVCLVPADPRTVFLHVARLVQAGRAGGYQYESMAVKLVVGVVERYLAEFRHVFSSDAECRAALVSVLDIFVSAGWPEAQRLTYRLDEIFR